jgi:rubrerythrin
MYEPTAKELKAMDRELEEMGREAMEYEARQEIKDIERKRTRIRECYPNTLDEDIDFYLDIYWECPHCGFANLSEENVCVKCLKMRSE